MTYISTQSLTSPLRQSILQAQSSLAQTQTEISSNAPADLGLTLGAQTGTSLSLKSQIDQLTMFTSSNDFATTRLSTTSTALGALISSAQSMSQNLLAATSAGGSTTGLASSGASALQSLIAQLNTSVGGQFVFSGIKTDTTPISDYFSATTSAGKQAVDTSFQQAFGTNQTSAGASSISGAAMTSFLDNQFDSLFSDSNWQSTWSSASSSTIQTTTAPSQTTATSVSANADAFKKVAEAYTMLTEFTGNNLSADARASVVTKASGLVSDALTSLTNLQSGVGVAQASISDSNDTMSAQVTVLKTHVSDLESVDTYDLSSKLAQLQTQLQASYQLTSQLQKLSLTNYLTG